MRIPDKKRLGSLFLSLLILSAFIPPSFAGKLDLNIYVKEEPVLYQPYIPPVPKGLWAPGSPLGLRGQSRGMRAFSHAGYATLGAVGLAENIRGMGKGEFNEVTAGGFGLIAIINLWRLWKVGREEPKKPRRKP